MIKSRYGVSIIKWSSRALVLSFAAMLMAVTGLVHAGTMNMPTAGGSAVRAWSVPYAPTSVGMVTGLQRFLRTETGAGLLAQVPSLGIIKHLSSNSEVHRRIVGAMALPAGFESQLEAALQTSDNKTLTSALVTILSAYHSRNAEGKIGEAVQARADEIVALVNQGKISVTELSAIASELAPFASISVKAKAVEEMANAARSAGTLDGAQQIAATLLQSQRSALPDMPVDTSRPIGNLAPEMLEASKLQPSKKTPTGKGSDQTVVVTGPISKRMFLHGVAHRDAVIAMHQEKNVLTSQGYVIVQADITNLSAGGDGIYSYEIKYRQRHKDEPSVIVGPYFQRSLAHGVAYRDARLAMHQAYRRLAAQGNVILRADVINLSAGGDGIYSYEVEYRPKRPDEANVIFGPYFQRGFLHGVAYRDALLAMREEKIRLSDQKHTIVSAGYMDLSAGGDGIYSFKIEYR